MSNVERTKEKVTLNDLKRDIEEFEYAKTRYTKHDGDYQAARADAWRTAFEWLVDTKRLVASCCGDDAKFHAAISQIEEGMKLIREKLQS